MFKIIAQITDLSVHNMLSMFEEHEGIVANIKHYNKQLSLVDEELEKLYHKMVCTLHTITGVNITTAVKILSEIGDINRFPNASKLAQFAGIAPLKLSSAGKGKNRAMKLEDKEESL